VQLGVLFVALVSKGDSEGIFPLILQGLPLGGLVGIAGGKQLDLLVESITGAEHRTELITVGIEEAEGAQVSPQVIRIL
jgi:hypothetical protein